MVIVLAEISPGLFTSLCIGLKGGDFVIIGASKRSLYGKTIISEKATLIKIFGKKLIVAFSGHIPDIQYMFREIMWFFQREKLDRERELSIEEVANFTGLILFSYKLFPNIAFGIVGGIDWNGKPKLYSLDPFGSTMEENVVASGISAEVAYGLLERSYRENISFEEAKELITRTLRSVARRDVLVGQYAELAYVGKNIEGEIETVKLF